MTDIHILRPSKETDKDKLSIDEAKKKLKPCPICGSKAYISKDIVDGFYFGWSVGCPRFCLNDGIHGIDEMHQKRNIYLFIILIQLMSALRNGTGKLINLQRGVIANENTKRL